MSLWYDLNQPDSQSVPLCSVAQGSYKNVSMPDVVFPRGWAFWGTINPRRCMRQIQLTCCYLEVFWPWRREGVGVVLKWAFPSRCYVSEPLLKARRSLVLSCCLLSVWVQLSIMDWAVSQLIQLVLKQMLVKGSDGKQSAVGIRVEEYRGSCYGCEGFSGDWLFSRGERCMWEKRWSLW